MRLVAANETVDRADRTFSVFSVMQITGVLVQGGGITEHTEVPEADLRELEASGLIETHHHNMSGTFQFDVTRAGREYVAAVRQRGEPLEQIEDHLIADPSGHADRIGFECREAQQAFANSLAALHGVEPASGHHRTIKAVIDARREHVGGTHADLLDALAKLWSAVNEVDQRQTHRHGDADDRRRCVFHTGLVMYELDRTLGSPR